MTSYNTYLNRLRQFRSQSPIGEDETTYGGGCGHGHGRSRGARFAGGPYAGGRRSGGPGGPYGPGDAGDPGDPGGPFGPGGGGFGGGPFGPGGGGFGGPGRGGFGGGQFGPRGPRGPFGPGGPGGPFWGGGGGRGPGRRRRGEVRNALLLLLAEEPRNGYQLMQEIEQRSDGQWRPSPGSVYPALSQLEDEGLVRNVQAETGRTFEITDAGRAQAESLGGQAPPWQSDDDPSARSTHTLRHLIMSSGMAAWQVAKDGDEQQIAVACDLLAQVRRTLYGILAGEPAPEPKPESDDVAGSEEAP